MHIMARSTGSFSSNMNGWFGTTTAHLLHHDNQKPNPTTTAAAATKKKRNLPGTPDPDAEVVALSPKTLMATNRFVCEICNKGFQRDQNLQLHRRGHNLPWKLRQRTNKDQLKKKVYICPEKSCVHHDPGRALGDLTGIKKHFSRKHGEKKWKCDKCSKKYAVQSDWKAHSKTCGTREYKCDCGTLFSRKDSFITHRAFCDALAEESARLTSVVSSNLSFGNRNNNVDDHTNAITTSSPSSSTTTMVNMDHILHGLGIMSGTTSTSHGFQLQQDHFNHHLSKSRLSHWLNQANNSSHNSNNINNNDNNPMDYVYNRSSSVQELVIGSTTSSTTLFGSCSSSMSSLVGLKEEANRVLNNSSSLSSSKHVIAPMSATALLQKAAQMGSTRSSSNPSFSTTNITTTTSSSSTGVMMIMNPSSSSATNSHVNVATTMAHHGYLDGSNLMRSLGSNISLSSSNIKGIENGGLTRDFLGSGSGVVMAQRKLLSHNSCGSSAMGLSQFSGNH
ncbi:zinc finger protein BALDIBIS [Cannabis sativa]|uniref:zinc finger protein BALDIBIS n=1 Tax=Cannabis sativa TaxID=3483 RepID=UPI0029C9E06E|nr:zinc finger protein BALDIBIS [Cannabis sativa]